MLTVAAIKAIKPQEKIKSYSDAERMYLEVTSKATAWMKDREGTIKPVTMTRDLSTFEKDLFPVIGDMPN